MTLIIFEQNLNNCVNEFKVLHFHLKVVMIIIEALSFLKLKRNEKDSKKN
jgi:hypothetical protein